MPTYSLSSATGRQAGSSNAKRVSAQLGRLMGSPSRLSLEQSRRGVLSEDGRAIAGCSANNRMSQAAAWMWHTRGIGDAHAAVVPTKQLLARANAANNVLNNSRKLGAAEGVAHTQPSRFKQEATTHNQAAATTSTSLEGNAHNCAEDQRPSPTLANELLYDDFELSHLQKLLDQTEFHKPHSKFSAQVPSSCCSSTSSASTSPSRQTKPFSAIHKLCKRLYTTVRSTHARINSAIETARPASTKLSVGPHKLSSVQHVIHHHHHHYHHYRSSLDLPAHHEQSEYPCEPDLHLQEFVRRRRHSYQSICNQEQRLIKGMVKLDHLVDDDSPCTNHSIHHPLQRTTAPMTSHIGLATDDDDKVDKRCGTNHDLRPVSETKMKRRRWAELAYSIG